MTRSRSVLAALVLSLAAALGARQDTQAPSAVRLIFPETADLTGLSIPYYLTGPFGGYGSGVRVRSSAHQYDIEAWHAGQAAVTLKAIIYCMGYQTVLVAQSGFGGGPPRVVSVPLRPLGSVALVGRVIGAPDPQRLALEVTYVAHWSHEFFGILDGPVAEFVVASATPGPDGSFAASVPDFARDPVVASKFGKDRGALRLLARDRRTWNLEYALQTADESPWARVPIADTYPNELLLTRVAK